MIAAFLRRIFTPTRITVTSFVALILVGAFFLYLPVSARGGKHLDFVDALFISTSAVCVTGLSPVAVGEKLSFFGQFVVLLLMQIGALGIMTFTTAFYYFFGSRLPLTDRITLQETFPGSPLKQLRGLIFYILGFTFTLEIIGTIALFFHWRGRFETASETLWQAVFHAVAAFTNGSFSLFSNSLIDFQKDFFTQFVITSLIIGGGIGFLVAFELKEFFKRKFFDKTKKRFRLSVQTKLALVTTAALLFAGTALIFIIERGGVFANLSTVEALFNSYFFAVVPRTSGFNTVQMSDFSGAGVLILMILMFVGGSPGSTAGGIKTTTFGLVVAYTIARLRGETRLDLWKKTIPQESIDKAGAVIMASAAVVLFAFILLMLTETRALSAEESNHRFVPLLFETISAFGTVGLTLDYTQNLTIAGKIIISVVMLVGRVGAISLVLSLSLNEKTRKFNYAEENVMIG